MQQAMVIAADGEAARLPGRQIRLFLADGTPQGLVLAEIGNWSGKALSAPRSRLPQLMKRAESARTGVYVLAGPDPDRLGGMLAYIGEADDVGARLRHHVRNGDKDFFDRIVIIVSTDENLTKAHARFLEGQLIRMTREAGSVALTNDTQPGNHRLPEADRVDMHFFVTQLGLVLPLLGFDLFRPSPGRAASSSASAGDVVFAFATAGASATARETDEGFAVLAGSTARKAGTGTFPAGYRALRDQVVQDGRLADGPTPELYRFTSDVAFTSPSAAASVVAARNASGPLEWKVTGTGQSYRDWRAAQLGEG